MKKFPLLGQRILEDSADENRDIGYPVQSFDKPQRFRSSTRTLVFTVFALSASLANFSGCDITVNIQSKKESSEKIESQQDASSSKKVNPFEGVSEPGEIDSPEETEKKLEVNRLERQIEEAKAAAKKIPKHPGDGAQEYDPAKEFESINKIGIPSNKNTQMESESESGTKSPEVLNDKNTFPENFDPQKSIDDFIKENLE